MVAPALLYDKRDGIAYITINRPEKRNAFSPEVICRLADAWQDYAADDALRVAIITGAGEQSFSAGADLGRLTPLMSGGRQPEDEWDHRLLKNPQLGQVATLRGITMYKPIIAAINGFCLAGGCELIQATDIRIAAEHATFALTEVKWSLLPFAGSMVRLPRQIPFSKAMEIMLVGDTFPAQEAYRIGLINYVVPADQVMLKAEELARKIADNGPIAVRKIKETVLRALSVSLDEGFKIENEAAREVLATEDAKEGPRAFMEKRKPQYTGK
ncbi:MAG: enoyl-CoA hydratase/isomerase family protein [Candidatus Binatia bacterium]